jgi:hypothetical protein
LWLSDWRGLGRLHDHATELCSDHFSFQSIPHSASSTLRLQNLQLTHSTSLK